MRDNTEAALTHDEKVEMALFHQFKQDPFFKHYLYNHLREYAEQIDDTLV